MWIIRIIFGAAGYSKEVTCDDSTCSIKKGKLTWCEYCPIYKEQDSRKKENEEKHQCVLCGKTVSDTFIGEKSDNGILCAACMCKGYYFHYDDHGGVSVKNSKGEDVDATYL